MWGDMSHDKGENIFQISLDSSVSDFYTNPAYFDLSGFGTEC